MTEPIDTTLAGKASRKLSRKRRALCKTVGGYPTIIPWMTPSERQRLSEAFRARKPSEQAQTSQPQRGELRAAARAKRRAEVAERRRQRELAQAAREAEQREG